MKSVKYEVCEKFLDDHIGLLNSVKINETLELESTFKDTMRMELVMEIRVIIDSEHDL